jgi:hypothetical protein
MNTATLDKILKALCVLLFVLWLPCWIYPASKMLQFTVNPLRSQLLEASIFLLILWAFSFAAMMRDIGKSNRPSKTGIRPIATQFIPLYFALFLGAVYAVFPSLYHSAHPNWPSPALPTEVCFAPIVYIVGFSVWQNSKIVPSATAKNKKPK